jgi:hypothetical protein
VNNDKKVEVEFLAAVIDLHHEEPYQKLSHSPQERHEAQEFTTKGSTLSVHKHQANVTEYYMSVYANVINNSCKSDVSEIIRTSSSLRKFSTNTGAKKKHPVQMSTSSSIDTEQKHT